MHNTESSVISDMSPLAEDLLVELGCEELPPKSLPLLGNTLLDGFVEQLRKSQLSFDERSSRVFYTPRRLGLLIRNVAAKQADQLVERKGPAVAAAFGSDNQPTPAALGFARSVGKNLDELDTLKTDKGEWLYCRIKKPGEQLQDLLIPMLEKSLAALPIAKPMRWASNDFSFIRPVHWLVLMHGANVIDARLFGLDAANMTRGHRIHSPGPHAIDTAGDYEAVLEKAFVIADQDKREHLIMEQAVSIVESGDGKALIDSALLKEVSNLVEWPRSVCGSFDPAFLEVPSEALIASMQDHQKFFPVVHSTDGSLLPRFIAVANLESLDFEAVRNGFERVIRPRLADARFFWEQDGKLPLDQYLLSLDSIIFQEKLGSVGDKSKRISIISEKIAEETNVDVVASKRAARLCKCDLVTQMVGEFPELQGVMGQYYARQSGEDAVVAQAIGEHYRPAYSGDDLPNQAVGKVVALADRLDTLTGIFAAGLKPTGNKDPFALRRAALGLIRILLDQELIIDLDRLLDISTGVVQQQIEVSDATRQDVRRFILERLKHYLRGQDYHTDLVNAALDAPLSTLPDLISRLDALDAFMGHEAADSLAAANKRIGNILRKAKIDTIDMVNEDLFNIKEERQLFEDISNISSKLDQLFIIADYSSALGLLAGLSGSIEAFFEHVMVMDDDIGIRENRLNLLARLKGLFDRIANLALIG